jgi:hypothetical protein
MFTVVSVQPSWVPRTSERELVLFCSALTATASRSDIIRPEVEQGREHGWTEVHQ